MAIFVYAVQKYLSEHFLDGRGDVYNDGRLGHPKSANSDEMVRKGGVNSPFSILMGRC